MTAADLLSRLENVKGRSGQWTASCPAHDDNNPSLSITEETDRILLKCHAGCTVESVVAALGLEMRDLYSNGGRGLEIQAIYPYVDEEHRELFQVVRLWGKEFRQRRRNGTGFEWNLRGVRRVLYRLPQVLEGVATGKPVFITEGEKDTDRLVSLGLIATCNPGGAKKWRSEFSEVLNGADAVIVPDNDEPGRDHAQLVARQLFGTAETVKIVELPGLEEAGDVSDWLDVGHTVDDLLQLAGDTAEWRPSSASREQRQPKTNGEPGDDPGLTDSDNSARLIELHGESLHYIPTWGNWLVWDGSHWVVDHRDVRVRELAKKVGQQLKHQAADEADTARAKQLWRFAMRTLDSQGITGMVNLARGIHGIPLDHEQLDADGWLLGVENGAVDLHTGELRPPDPADLMTRRAPVYYDPDAEAPRWEQALIEWFPNEDVRNYVQRVAGQALVGVQSEHIFVIHYGTGGNGKGTFTRALNHVLGPYSVEIHLSLLVETKYREHDTVKADLFRTRLALAVETERRIRLAEASVKNLSGGDRIRARRMREDPWSFDPTHSLWLQTNHLPQISGRDTGIWRRIRVVEWVSRFIDKAAERNLDDKLAAEAPGILAWMVRGCLAWQEHGLNEPEPVKRATLKYRSREDIFTRFAADVGLEFGKGCEIQAQELQTLLTEWADEEGIDPPRQEVGDWLRDQGCRQRRQYRIDPDGQRRHPRLWLGVSIGESANGTYEDIERMGLEDEPEQP